MFPAFGIDRIDGRHDTSAYSYSTLLYLDEWLNGPMQAKIHISMDELSTSQLSH